MTFAVSHDPFARGDYRRPDPCRGSQWRNGGSSVEHASHSPVDRPGKYDTMAAPMISMAKIGMMWRWPAACSTRWA